MIQKEKTFLNKLKLKNICFLVFVVFIFSFLGASQAKAVGNVYGWAWTENIGWISFNDMGLTQTGAESDAPNGLAIPAGINTSDPHHGVHYGVNIKNDGTLEGYAWSENIGWIKFDNNSDSIYANGYPAAPYNSAKVDLVPYSAQKHKLSGWVRVCSVFQTGCSGALNSNSGGWDGWIKLNDNNYNAYIDTSSDPAQFHHWEWGGNPDNDANKSVIGWGTFNCLEGGVGGASVCLNASPNNAANYRVVTTFLLEANQDPYVDGFNFGPDYCSYIGAGLLYFNWTYHDLENDLETKNMFQVSTFSNFHNLIIDNTETIGTNNTRWVDVPGELPFGGTYYWRVKVFNNNGDSGWIQYNDPADPDGDGNAKTFTTPPHAHPSTKLDLSPETPSPATLISGKANFTFDASSSICYGAPATCTYNWVFGVDSNCPEAEPTCQTDPTPNMYYSSKGPRTVSLTVTDIDGLHCPKTLDVNVKNALKVPEWQEISPF